MQFPRETLINSSPFRLCQRPGVRARRSSQCLPLLLCLVLLWPQTLFAGEPVVLVFGDSLSAAYGIDHDQGWPQLLQQRLQQAGYPHRVANASISGDTTSAGLARLPRSLEQHTPEVLILALGANDGLRGIAQAEMKQNLARMIELARQQQARVLLVGMYLPPNYGADYIARFHAVYTRLADELEVALVPFMLAGLMLDDELTPDASLFQSDGIHPEAKAQPLILDIIWPQLAPLL